MMMFTEIKIKGNDLVTIAAKSLFKKDMQCFPHFTATQPKNPNSVSHTLFVQFQDYFFPESAHCLNRAFIFKL